jgi:hypothetical protein
MAWTYTTLTEAILDYVESDEETLVSQIPNIIQQAEDRIIKSVQLPDFRKNVTGIVTGSNQYLGIPTDFLSVYSLAVDNTGYEYLLFKDVSFIREAYPQDSVTGVPKFYSIFDDQYFLLAPTPDTNYAVELHYFHKPESIVTAGTSWLGTNAPAVILWGSILEAQTFLKGDPDEMATAKEQYESALLNLKMLGEGRNKIDSYRSGI